MNHPVKFLRYHTISSLIHWIEMERSLSSVVILAFQQAPFLHSGNVSLHLHSAAAAAPCAGSSSLPPLVSRIIRADHVPSKTISRVFRSFNSFAHSVSNEMLSRWEEEASTTSFLVRCTQCLCRWR